MSCHNIRSDQSRPVTPSLNAALYAWQVISHCIQQRSVLGKGVQGRCILDDLCCSPPCLRHPCGPLETLRRACQAAWRQAVAPRWRAPHTAPARAALPASWLQGL